MFARAARLSVIVPLIAALAVATTPVDARGGRGGGGFGRGGGGGFGGGGRSAPTSVNRSYGGGGRANYGGRGDRARTGNVNVGNNVNVNVDRGWNAGYGGVQHPVAAGLAVGAVAGMTAAAIGSSYYDLPSGCSPYATSYYYCGGAYYQPQYEGTSVKYVVVEKPPE